MRHRPDGVGLTARATTQECTQIGGNGPSGPFWVICVHCWAVCLGCGWPWDRNSVHKWEDRASPRRFGAFVYTVALLRAAVGTQECTQIGGNGLSVPFWGICVHCCDANCVRWHERLSRHGVPAAPPRWSLSLGREDRLCASGAAARLASLPRRQPTRTPEEPYIASSRRRSVC